MMPLRGRCRGQISDKRIHHHKLKIFVHYSPVIPLISGNPVTNISLIFLDRFVEDFEHDAPTGQSVGWIAPRIYPCMMFPIL